MLINPKETQSTSLSFRLSRELEESHQEASKGKIYLVWGHLVFMHAFIHSLAHSFILSIILLFNKS